jgi:hypothetical protein
MLTSTSSFGGSALPAESVIALGKTSPAAAVGGLGCLGSGNGALDTGVTWMLRPSSEGVRIVQHGGALTGQRSGFLMVPERGFAFTMLTNSDGGDQLHNDLFVDDWALRWAQVGRGEDCSKIFLRSEWPASGVTTCRELHEKFGVDKTS